MSRTFRDPALLLLAALGLGTTVHAQTAASISGMLGPASAGTLASVFFFFLKAGAFVFGSGLAIVPFLSL